MPLKIHTSTQDTSVSVHVSPLQCCLVNLVSLSSAPLLVQADIVDGRGVVRVVRARHLHPHLPLGQDAITILKRGREHLGTCHMGHKRRRWRLTKKMFFSARLAGILRWPRRHPSKQAIEREQGSELSNPASKQASGCWRPRKHVKQRVSQLLLCARRPSD